MVKQLDDQTAAAERQAQRATRRRSSTHPQETADRSEVPKDYLRVGDHSGAPEPVYGGQPLSQFLRHGTNQISLDAMLTLKQVVTGDEPEVVTYQLPISYDALESIRSPTNAFPNGHLMLLMDCDPDDSFRHDPELNEISHTTNVECRLAGTPRPNARSARMQALLEIQLGATRGLQSEGPSSRSFQATFVSSSLLPHYGTIPARISMPAGWQNPTPPTASRLRPVRAHLKTFMPRH